MLLNVLPLPLLVLQELISKCCISPDCKHLLTLSTSSTLCLYQLPSLKLARSWALDLQPCSDALSPALMESPRKSRYLRDTPHYQSLVDAQWWDDNAVILARYSGAVVVADIDGLSNLLGDQPEWFEPCPRLQPAHNQSFLSLECEVKTLSRKRSVSESADTDSDDEADGRGFVHQTTRVLRDALFYITDMDRFEPPKKKTR